MDDWYTDSPLLAAGASKLMESETLGSQMILTELQRGGRSLGFVSDLLMVIMRFSACINGFVGWGKSGKETCADWQCSENDVVDYFVGSYILFAMALLAMLCQLPCVQLVPSLEVQLVPDRNIASKVVAGFLNKVISNRTTFLSKMCVELWISHFIVFVILLLRNLGPISFAFKFILVHYSVQQLSFFNLLSSSSSSVWLSHDPSEIVNHQSPAVGA